jgi:hypothetical protein
MDKWIETQTANLIKEHSDDLQQRVEIFVINSVFPELNEVLSEIINDFKETEKVIACVKLNVILKMLINNQSYLLGIKNKIDSDELDIILELSISLLNAIAIQKSPSLQNLIIREQNNDEIN